MRRVFAVPGFVLFAVSLAVHVLAWVGFDASAHIPGVFGLHFAAMLYGFITMPFMYADGVFPRQRGGIFRKRVGWNTYIKQLTAHMPDFAGVMVGGFFYYIIVNFLVGWFALFSGIGGAGTMHSAFIMRMFSGHWMWFFLAPAMYLWYPDPVPYSEDGKKKEIRDADGRKLSRKEFNKWLDS